MMAHHDERDRFFERMVAEAGWDQAVNTAETDRRLEVIFSRLLGPVALEGQRLLDAGSGGGHFAAAALDRGARVTALDVGPNLLGEVHRRCGGACRRLIASVGRMPVADGSFDVVLSTEVIEHTADPLASLAELARVVRGGGHLLLTTPCRLWQPVVRGATRLGLRPYEGRENFLWPRAARRQLEGRGFVVEDLFGFNLLPLFDRRLAPLHRLADRVGRLAPALYVNFGLRARRQAKGS